jgi:hypothetical protein
MDATKAGSTWPGYIQKAIGNIKDTKIITHFFEYKNTPGHPNINEQHAMAKSLIECIDNNVKW